VIWGRGQEGGKKMKNFFLFEGGEGWRKFCPERQISMRKGPYQIKKKGESLGRTWRRKIYLFSRTEIVWTKRKRPELASAIGNPNHFIGLKRPPATPQPPTHPHPTRAPPQTQFASILINWYFSFMVENSRAHLSPCRSNGGEPYIERGG